jgi:eukaryotic-like serine/threonine-protein kinase
MNAPESPKSLGRYQLLFMLGQGGMGEVHLAKLTGAAGFEKLCIVKTILPQMQADPQFVERFHHEARVLVHLNHSHIAQVYDMGEFEGTLYMAIEYVAGVDLSRVMSRVKRQGAVMPLPIALYLAQQICEALGYAHRKTGPDGTPLGIVHRDVSPQNVMVSYEGEVKVIDFGLAKSAVRSQHTLPQTVMGKLGYMSPEQAQAKPVDYRSDLFSAGIVVWEMLTGRPLYQGGTMGEMVAQMAFPTIPSPRTLRPEVSTTLEQIVMGSLQADPSARYARGDEFSRALNELAVREGLTVGAEEVGNYVRAMCPEEFAAERKLQSQLSMMRKRGSSPPAQVPAEVDNTLLRPSKPGVPSGGDDLTPAQRALSVTSSSPPAPRPLTNQVAKTLVPSSVKEESPSEPIVVPRSRVPMVIGAVLVVGLLGGGAVMMRPSTTPPAPVEPAKPALPEKEKPTAEPVTEKAEPEAVVSRPDETEGSLGTVKVNGTELPVRVDEDEAIIFIEPGQRSVFKEADSVVLIGEPDGDKKATIYARGTVYDLKPTLVKIGIIKKKGDLAQVKYAHRDESVKATPLVRREPKKAVVATPDAGARPQEKPAEVAKIDPSQLAQFPEPGKQATPEPAKEPEPVKQVAATSNPVRQLQGAISISIPSSRGGQIVRVQNNSGLLLTGCTIRLTSNRTGPLGALGAGSTVKLKYSEFRADSRPADPNFEKGWSAVYCREGTGYFFTTWER